MRPIYFALLLAVGAYFSLLGEVNKDEKRDADRENFQATYEESMRRASELEKEVRHLEKKLEPISSLTN